MKHYCKLLGVFSLIFSSFMAAHAENASDITAQQLDAWSRTILNTPVPFDSCFHAAFPETMWTQIACGVAPSKSFRNSLPALRQENNIEKHGVSSTRILEDNNRIQTVGGGGPTDWLAHGTNLPTDFSTGARIGASGSFPAVTGVTSEYDASGGIIIMIIPFS